MRQLSPAGLVALAVAEGATSPDPGYYAVVYSTTTGNVMRWNGTSWGSLSSLSPPLHLSGSSTDPILKVTQTGAGDALVVEDESGDLTPFVIDSTGRHILGQPAAITVINRASGAAAIPHKQQIGNGEAAASQLQASFSGTAAASIILARSTDPTIGNHGILSSGDELGSILALGSDGVQWRRGASIDFVAEGSWSAGDTPTGIHFYTTKDGTAAPSPAMFIRPSGIVSVLGGLDAGPKFSVHPSGAQSLANATFTRLNMQTVEHDAGGYFNNTGATVDGIPPYAFSCPQDGKYLFVAGIGWGGAYNSIVQLYVNGSANARGVRPDLSPNTQVVSILDLVYGDYVQVYGWQSSGGSLSTIGGLATMRFQGFYLGT
jgi:hypothetical protein